ncbi:10157_t:CDS:2 [Cetraspora pellucida]|uniref:10157_t:CDS:1 n=1 Tax=Cetraspora pellucida TaxID=1433469 RepID=A0A9N9CVI2_9GLOM|nr:10157_t:CDS:2 [Cetraspora pellucida]
MLESTLNNELNKLLFGWGIDKVRANKKPEAVIKESEAVTKESEAVTENLIQDEKLEIEIKESKTVAEALKHKSKNPRK